MDSNNSSSEPKLLAGKNLPPSLAEQKLKKHDHVLIIINTTSQHHDGLRPLVELLKRSGYVELNFPIDASHFKDSQGLHDSVVEEFKKRITEKVAKDAVVFVYIQGRTTCVHSSMDIAKDIKMMYMGAIVIDKMDSNEMVYLLAHDIQTLLTELDTDFLTIFLDGHYDHSSKGELMLSRKSDKKFTKNLNEHLKSMWMAMVPLQSRVVLLTTYPEFHVAAKCPCISLHDKVTSVIEWWIKAGLLSQGSHREFYESISYLLYQEGRMSLGYIFIQGDKERQFCGKDYLPYDHWVAGNLATSQDVQHAYDPLQKDIVVVLGSLLEFKKDEEIIIFHLLQPMNRANGKVTKVTNQYCLVKMTDGESSPVRSLVQDICKTKSAHHFISVKKIPKSLLKQRIPVDICIDDKQISEQLIASLNKSAFLRVATERDKESVVVRQEVDRTNITYYVVVDQAKDVTQVKVAINNPSQLKVVLMRIAWFKYVKKLKKTKNILLFNLNYTCSATSEKRLLDYTLVPHKLEITASSQREGDPVHAILQFTGASRYWKPATNDIDSCYIDIDLKANHSITAVELRGDAQNEEFIKTFDLLCQTFEFQNVEISCGGKVQIESSSGVTKSIVAKKLSLNMQNYNQFDNCIFRFMQQDVSGTGTIPVAVDDADKEYTQNNDGWIEVHKLGNKDDILTVLFTFREPILLRQLQFEGSTRGGIDHKAIIRLQYFSDWRREPMEGCSSVWPVKRELFSPMKAALVRVVPTSYNIYPALQLQLHGNPVHEGKAVEVFDTEQVTFYFCNNMEDRGLFFNVLCLEETGAIQMLLSEYVERNQSKKRIMEVFIQENHDCSSTVDIYKIYVSQRKPVLDTLMQDSLLDYEKPASYSVYSFGSPIDDMMNDDPWDITDIPIHIKSSSKLYKR